MKYQSLNEKPTLGDTIKTSLKAAGSRFGNAALATAGSYVGAGDGARGRLSVRIMADRMMRGWLIFKNSSGQPGNRANLYRYLSDEFQDVVDDATMRQIMGIAPAPSQAVPPAAQPTVAPAATTVSQQVKPYDAHVASEIQTLYQTVFDAIKRRAAVTAGRRPTK